MYQNQYSPYMPNQNSIIWVQGIEGAKAYQLMPNSNALLLDSENDGVFYIKLCDSVGMCTLRTFKYEEVIECHKNDVPIPDLEQFVTKEEFTKAINELKEAMNGK